MEDPETWVSKHNTEEEIRWAYRHSITILSADLSYIANAKSIPASAEIGADIDNSRQRIKLLKMKALMLGITLGK